MEFSGIIFSIVVYCMLLVLFNAANNMLSQKKFQEFPINEMIIVILQTVLKKLRLMAKS